MTGPDPCPPRHVAAPIAGTPADLTHVDLTWIEHRVEQWLRFGRPVREHRHDRACRTLSFSPGVIFALVHWASNDIGTILSQLAVVRAAAPGAAIQTLPLVRPGGEVLLRVDGWPKVERALRHVDAIEASGTDLAEVDPDHWRHVHHRMTAGQEPSAYTAARHHAWLKRRRIEG